MRGAVRTVARAGQWAYAACPICNKIDEFRRVRRALTPRPFGHLDAWHSYGWRMARHWPSSMCIWVPLAGTVGILLLATTALYVMGRPLICPCGYIKIFHPGTDDREVSQHFIDAYTYSHLTRGILLYAVLYLVAWARPRVTWGVADRGCLGRHLGAGRKYPDDYKKLRDNDGSARLRGWQHHQLDWRYSGHSGRLSYRRAPARSGARSVDTC